MKLFLTMILVGVILATAIVAVFFGDATPKMLYAISATTPTATATPPPSIPSIVFQQHPYYSPARSGPIPYGGNGWSPSENPQP